MALKIAINGYGRIGRNVHRLSLEHPDLSIRAINSRADAYSHAYLFKYDSLHGHVGHDVYAENEKTLIIDKKPVDVYQETDNFPWKKYDLDIVIECTGKGREYEKAKKHLDYGAKKVLITAPSVDPKINTFVLGVNENKIDLKKDLIISNASCTTNCIAPPLKILNKAFGIKSAFVTSIHSFTNSQNLLDNSAKDFRRARSAVMSIIPTNTGAIKATGRIIKELNGKLDGLAFRVPIATSSVCDVDLHFEKDVSVEEINNLFSAKVNEDYYSKIIAVSSEPLVSIDFKTNSHSCIVDLPLTQVINKRYAKIILWYDNEWGYAKRLCDMLEILGQNLL